MLGVWSLLNQAKHWQHVHSVHNNTNKFLILFAGESLGASAIVSTGYHSRYTIRKGYKFDCVVRISWSWMFTPVKRVKETRLSCDESCRNPWTSFLLSLHDNCYWCDCSHCSSCYQTGTLWMFPSCLPVLWSLKWKHNVNCSWLMHWHLPNIERWWSGHLL